jgi:plasmid stabilization system protein ParE
MTSMRLLVQAREELRDAAEYYESRVRGLGVEFTHHVDKAISDIQQNPERWPIVEQGVRRRLISRFPYCLLYRADADETVILAVMHLRRHPNYWVNRGRK